MPANQPPTTQFSSSPAPVLADHAHAALLKHTELQFDFSTFKPPQPPWWLEWILNYIFRPLGWLLSHPVGRYAFWVLLAAVIGFGLFVLGRWILRRAWTGARDEAPGGPAPPDWSLSPVMAKLLLSDADAMAAEGRYAEAIHYLLLRSVGDIAERRPELLTPALTGREISVLPGLPDPARRAFAEIARVVERAVFAGRDVGASDYAACRDEYERFALPDLWQLKRAA